MRVHLLYYYFLNEQDGKCNYYFCFFRIYNRTLQKMGKTRKNENKVVDKIKSGSHSLNPGIL